MRHTATALLVALVFVGMGCQSKEPAPAPAPPVEPKKPAGVLLVVSSSRTFNGMAAATRFAEGLAGSNVSLGVVWVCEPTPANKMQPIVDIPFGPPERSVDMLKSVPCPGSNYPALFTGMERGIERMEQQQGVSSKTLLFINDGLGWWAQETSQVSLSHKVLDSKKMGYRIKDGGVTLGVIGRTMPSRSIGDKGQELAQMIATPAGGHVLWADDDAGFEAHLKTTIEHIKKQAAPGAP